MSADFSTFNINDIQEDPHHILELGNGVIADIAAKFLTQLPVRPTSADLFGLVKAVAPHKTLQDNLGVPSNPGSPAHDMCIEWLEQAGCMKELNRPFAYEYGVPSTFAAAIITGGVANWQLRRRKVVEGVEPHAVGKVWLPVGIREMRESEHALVGTTATWLNRPVTEVDFAREHIAFPLQPRFDVETYEVDSTNGDEILRRFFEEHPDLTGGTILVIGNAPNTVQAAVQVRLAARSVHKYFDIEGSQLFMRGDSFPIARDGEPPALAQNPVTGLGQLLRLAALLMKAAGH